MFTRSLAGADKGDEAWMPPPAVAFLRGWALPINAVAVAATLSTDTHARLLAAGKEDRRQYTRGPIALGER